MEKIENLTAEQAEILPRFRGQWFAHGTSTARADRARFEAAIIAMRAEIGISALPIFVWCQSPATCLMAIEVVKSKAWRDLLGSAAHNTSLRDSLGDSLGDSLWDSLRDSLGVSLGDSLRDSLGDSLRDSLRVSLGDSVGDSLRDSLWDSLGDSVGDSLRDSLWASLGDPLGDSLWASLWASLRDSLGDSLRDSLGDSLGDSLRDSLRDSLWASLGVSLGDSLANAWWGQHESYWVAFYLFCRDVIGVTYDEKRSRQLDMWRDIAQSCCWWFPFRNYVFISERPTIVSMDDRERIHSAIGPAIAFADGWEVFAWHGTRVPAEWIKVPGKLDPQVALTHQNIEQRRAASEIVGWAKVLAAVGARTINKNRNPEIGELLEADLPDAPKSRFLRVRCATGREFVLPVPQEMKTAREANAWTYGVTPQEYRPQVRT